MAKRYSYRAKDAGGQAISGVILAESPSSAAAHIRDKGYFVTQIKEQGGGVSLSARLAGLRRVGTKDMAVLCRQFSTMINAGMPMVTCLNILIDQTDNPRIKGALQDVYKKVREGSSLSQAMADHPKVFPPVMVNMVEAGEVGGVLDKILDRLAVHFEKNHKLNEKVKSAMVYPAVVITIAILAVTFILTFVLPTFVQVLNNLRMELPLPTRVLIAVSTFMRDHVLLLAALLVAAVAAAGWAVRTHRGREYADRLVLALPVFGKLARKIAIARFSRTLSTLLHGGVPIIAAMEVVKRTLNNVGMARDLTRAQAGVREGQSLAATLASSNAFTPMVVQMVAIGEESGALDPMLEKVADFYEADVDDMVGRLSGILEPFIIMVLGVVVGFIVVSVVIPLFDAVTNIGRMH